MSSVRPGDLLAGKYRVERVLGQGGMGYVVAARHLQLDQMVAIKFLRRGALDETEATNRFLREAKAVVRLKNEHVARVSDVGTLDTGEPYIVMEYLEGQDLSALSKQRPQLPVGEAVEYVMQACDALAEAHGLGIIHRDIKLANLFVARGPGGAPLVKVLDFGISKTNPFGESEHEMTRTSSMLGSPRFMSPEQMRDARSVDGRSDIWSLGVVLYRLVAGKAPFEADTLGALLSMVMHEIPTPLSAHRADLPPGFEAVVLRCLEKDPAHRFSSVAELAYALAPYAIDPVRARTAADRVAITVGVASVPPAMTAFPSAPPSSSRLSGPPGASDTGTAAPWAGTHGGARPSRAPLVLASLALALVIGVGGALAKVRMDRAHADAARAEATAAAVVQPSPAPPETEPAPPTTLVPAALPAPPPTMVVAATPPEHAPPTKAPHEADARKRIAPAPAKKAVRPKEPAQAAAAAPKDEGIPTTRD